jgi:hypothetical protein
MHIWGLNGVFLHFQKGHPLHIIGKQAFDLLHLYWVKRMKIGMFVVAFTM